MNTVVSEKRQTVFIQDEYRYTGTLHLHYIVHNFGTRTCTDTVLVLPVPSVRVHVVDFGHWTTGRPPVRYRYSTVAIKRLTLYGMIMLLRSFDIESHTIIQYSVPASIPVLSTVPYMYSIPVLSTE